MLHSSHRQTILKLQILVKLDSSDHLTDCNDSAWLSSSLKLADVLWSYDGTQQILHAKLSSVYKVHKSKLYSTEIEFYPIAPIFMEENDDYIW